MGIKNTLLDVHNILMEQLERLNGAETEEELEIEIKRSKPICETSKVIVDNANLMLQATKYSNEYGATRKEINPILLESGEE